MKTTNPTHKTLTRTCSGYSVCFSRTFILILSQTYFLMSERHTYPVDCVLLVTTLRLAALRISLSSVATIWVNLGRKFLSFTQQSSMS